MLGAVDIDEDSGVPLGEQLKQVLLKHAGRVMDLPISPLYLPYISLYLPYISPISPYRTSARASCSAISPLYLPYISLYLPYISLQDERARILQLRAERAEAALVEQARYWEM